MYFSTSSQPLLIRTASTLILASILALNPTSLSAKPAPLTAAEQSFFETNIRPVLAEHCYECHNSVNKKKGELALDWRDALLAGGENGKVIIPGNPSESRLIQAIRHENDLDMPNKAPKLTGSVIRDFETWVKMGAPDPRTKKPSASDLEKSKVPWQVVRDRRAQWWSFQPLHVTNPPTPKSDAGVINTIDHFILAKLNTTGLDYAPKANRHTLIRRLTLLLTGLPPNPQDVKQFVESKDPKFYEKQVDALLASEEYGRTWARHWMDWYRYAESHGSEGDPIIPQASRYRDYLITALNQDVPYNQLLKEHIAGDLLPHPRINEKTQINESAIGPAHFRMVAHGFGVTDSYDEQITFTDNQIDVMTKAMMGLTVSCARCHNHKFDPISQKDFYKFYGIMIGNKHTSVLIDSKSKQDAGKKEMRNLKKDIRNGLADAWLKETATLTKRLTDLSALQPEPTPLPPRKKKMTRKENERRRKAEIKHRAVSDSYKAFHNSGHPFHAWTLRKMSKDDLQKAISTHQHYSGEIDTGNEAARREAVTYWDFRKPAYVDKWHALGNGIGSSASPAGSFSLHADGDSVCNGIYPSGLYTHLLSKKHSTVWASSDFYIKGKRGQALLAGSDSRAKLNIRNYPLVNGLLHPSMDMKTTFNWADLTRKWAYWQDDYAYLHIETSNKKNSWFGIRELLIGDRGMRNETVSLFDLIDSTSTILDQDSLLDAYTRTLVRTIGNWKNGIMTDKEAAFLDAFVRWGVLENSLTKLPAPLQIKIKSYRKFESTITLARRAPGLLESDPVNQPILARGDYKQEGPRVKRGFLEVFGGGTYSKGSGRLELADDMVSKKNTLKTRLLVNRLWAYIFGQGLVSSTDNFGRLGAEPTHPDLLDYLAIDFEKNGWSIKHSLKQMVMSRTFRSQSLDSPITRETDPQNKNLSYFTPRRLSAEAIHDSIATLAKGSVSRAIFKPGRRNRLDPFMIAFNQPIPVSTVSARKNTNVPAQALTMMNKYSVQYSQALHEKLSRDKSITTADQRLDALFMICFSRPITQSEREHCETFLAGPKGNLRGLCEALLNSKEIIYVY